MRKPVAYPKQESLHEKSVRLLSEKSGFPQEFVKRAVTYVNTPSWNLLADPKIGGGSDQRLRDWFLDLVKTYKHLRRYLGETHAK